MTKYVFGKNSEDKLFRTRNLHEGVALKTSGIKFVGIESIGKTCWFIFEGGKESDEIVKSYWRGELKGNLRQFVSELKVFKELIFGKMQNGK